MNAGDESREVNLQGRADAPDLHDIESPFTPFALAHEGLSLPQPPGELLLCEAGALPRLAKVSKEDAVVPRENRLLHAVRGPRGRR